MFLSTFLVLLKRVHASISMSILTTLTRLRTISTLTYALPRVKQTIILISLITYLSTTLLSASIYTTNTTARTARLIS
jgi:hypothetical protein